MTDKKYTKKKSFFDLLKESLIFGLLITLSNILSEKLKTSKITQYFTSYDYYSKNYKSSLLSKFALKIKPSLQTKQTAKNAISKKIDNSLFVKQYKAFVNHWLCSKVANTGISLFIFGLTTSVFYVVDLYFDVLDTSFSSLIIGLLLTIASISMMMSKAVWNKSIIQSLLVGTILLSIANFREPEINRDNIAEKGLKRYIFFGLLFGTAGLFVTPLYIILAVIGLIFVMLIIYKPEFGCILAFGLMPFLPTMALCGLILLVSASYFLKILRGKRTIKLESIDYSVLVFMIMMILGGVFSVSTATSIYSAAVFVCLILSYFLITNLLNSTELIKKAVLVSAFSLLICSVYGLYQNFFGGVDTTWIDNNMFEDIDIRVYSTFSNPNVFGEYLIMIIPIVLASFLKKQTSSKRFGHFIILCAACSVLVFTWSRGAWLGFIISMVLFFLLYNKYTLIVYTFGLFSLPFVINYLPQNIITRITSIGNLRDTSTSYRVSIWEASVKIIKDYFFSGIGIGEGAFTKIYPNYTQAGIEAAPHSHMLYMQILIELGIFGLFAFIFCMILILKKTFLYHLKGSNREMKIYALASTCGIIAILLQGFTDYVWYNYRVFGLFWMLCGLTIAIIKSAKNEEINENY